MPRKLQQFEPLSQDKQKIKEFIESHLFIINKHSQNVPFKLNSVQMKFLREMNGRDIILKARQQGFSSFILALFTYDFLFRPNSRQVVVSHEASATQKLLDKVKHFIEPFGIPMKYNSRNEMHNATMNSVFYIGTAGSGTFGRGDTITNLHASEVAFYNEADNLMTGLLQSVPKDGRVFLESTANGMGNYFHREWEKGVNNASNFKTHFFSWKETKEYRLPKLEEPEFSATDKDMMMRYGLDTEQMLWRRFKCSEFKSEKEFNQEYPITPDVAFISSGTPVFDMPSLAWYKGNVKTPLFVGNLVGTRYKMALDEGENGFLKIWEKPKDVEEYVIGADVAEKHDFSCAYVIKKRNFEVVAVWHGQLPADAFGRELERLGYYYNTALVGVERNNQGIATLVTLNASYYPMLHYREDINDTGEKTTTKLGWETNMRTRPILISDLGMAIRQRQLAIWDDAGLREMMTFVVNKNGKEEAQSGCHDDRVMALAIAIQMYKRSPANLKSGNPIVRESMSYNSANNDFDSPSTAFDVY